MQPGFRQASRRQRELAMNQRVTQVDATKLGLVGHQRFQLRDLLVGCGFRKKLFGKFNDPLRTGWLIHGFVSLAQHSFV